MNGPLQTKSYRFALDIVSLSRELMDRKEFILSRQILKSGTAVGALIREAEFAESRKDFASKMSISLKEANESRYWLDLLFDSGFIPKSQHLELRELCTELIRMLVKTVKSARLP
ncbi:MAG: four helix bundle protein [Saprospiraceae bacterium]|nr:four helix bundle protein [Saprospiraceae bacterium]